MCSNNETITSQYNKDLETSSKNKYQIGSEVLRKLEDEGFNTELIQPERQPTFDELVEELGSIGETKPCPNAPTYYIFVLKMIDLMGWINKVKTYVLHIDVLDSKIIEFHYCPNIKLITTLTGANSFEYIKCLATDMLGRKYKLYDYTNNRSFISYITYYDGTAKNHEEIYKVSLDICTRLCMDHLNFSRLNKTINKVETLSCDILTQGRELSDHRSTLDLISETVDNNSQDFIKHEQRYKSHYGALQNRLAILETSARTTAITNANEIEKINTRFAEQNTIIEVMSSNIDNNTQTDDLLLFQYRQLNQIYLQLEDRVSKMEETQNTDIQTMETYIIKLNKRLDKMDKREEDAKVELNSKIKHLEDLNLNRYHEWVLLVALYFAIISYIVYKVKYIL